MNKNVSIPSPGVEWHMSSRWDLEFTSYNMLLTDLVDNISSAGVGVRWGDQKMIRFCLPMFR